MFEPINLEEVNTVINNCVCSPTLIAISCEYGLPSTMIPFILVRLSSSEDEGVDRYMTALVGSGMGFRTVRFHRSLSEAKSRFAEHICERNEEVFFMPIDESIEDSIIAIGNDFVSKCEGELMMAELENANLASFELIEEMLREFVGNSDLIALNVWKGTADFALPIVVASLRDTKEREGGRFLVAVLAPGVGPLDVDFYPALDEAMANFCGRLGASRVVAIDKTLYEEEFADEV